MGILTTVPGSARAAIGRCAHGSCEDCATEWGRDNCHLCHPTDACAADEHGNLAPTRAALAAGFRLRVRTSG